MSHKSIFVYQGEKPREMTKREFNKYVEHRKDCKEVFEAFRAGGFFNDEKYDTKTYLDMLIQAAAHVQWEIGHRSDYIRRDMVKEVQQHTSKQISKKLFLDLVNWMKDHTAGKESDLESVENKLDKEYATHLYRQSLKNILYKNFVKHGTVKVPKEQEIESQKIPDITLEDDPYFTKIIKKCADVRYDIDYVYYPEYKRLAMAAEHITRGDLTYDRFKTLVNYNYYCWTDSKEDAWEAQFNKYTHTQLVMDFMESYTLCEQYGYGYFFDEVKSYIIEQYLAEQHQKQEKYEKEMMAVEIENPIELSNKEELEIA